MLDMAKWDSVLEYITVYPDLMLGDIRVVALNSPEETMSSRRKVDAGAGGQAGWIEAGLATLKRTKNQQVQTRTLTGVVHL